MPTSRALCGAIFLAAAVVLSVALPTDMDAVVPEESLVEAIMSSDLEDSAAELEMKTKKTLDALTALKAYAVSAADKALDYKEAHSRSTDTAIINFVALYAQESVKDKNLVTAYAKAMGKSKAIFTGGIGRYLLEHLSRSMKTGIDVTTQARIDGKNMRRLSGAKLGLVSQPKYLNDLAVFESNYQGKFYEIKKHADSADAEAATEWLLAGEKQQYKSFKQREDEADAAKEKAHMEKKTAEALKAIKASFDKSGKLPGLSESGVAGAEQVADLKGVRTEKEKQEAAKAAAEKWRKENSATDASKAEQDEVEVKSEEAEKKMLFEERQTKTCKAVDCGLGKLTVGCSIPQKGDGYICTCPTGYVGGGLKKACQDRNECDGVDCGEGGTCEQKVGQTDNSYKCKCQEGFTGGGKNKGCSKPAAPAYASAPATPPVVPSVLQCQVASAKSNKAGVVKPSAIAGATVTGGGIINHYRKWDKKAGFEESYPEGNQYRCDMGFGPGQVTCYGIYCSVSNAKTPLECTTKSTSFNGSGMRVAKLPAGYTMTGGGLKNNQRTWDSKAGFEESRPDGDNGWAGDMGFGPGKYTAYVRGCKGLTCKTVAGKRGNTGSANCPSGYQVTGCGIKNFHRKWDKKSGFEQTNPKGNGCFCDGGFGAGDVMCYARCCKLPEDELAPVAAASL